jgi:transposase
LSEKEREMIQQTARSRTGAVRQVERAQIMQASSGGMSVSEMASRLPLKEGQVRQWIKPFKKEGLSGLEDVPRSGRAATYMPEEVSEVVGAALTDPQTLGLPFASWMEVRAIGIKRRRIDDSLLREGLRWRHQESWFGERIDPDFRLKGAD